MTSPERGRRGKEKEWSKRLWDAYTLFGESDAGYVQACNQFLDAMVRYRLHETMELILHLALHLVLKARVPNPERYKSHTSGIASLLLPEVSKAKDERDIYRCWWDKHIRWKKAKECLCERKPVELDRLHGLLSPKVGERQRMWRMHPMFLSACVQVARRSLEEDGFTHLEFYTPQGELGINDPIPAGEPLWITINRRMETYLQSGQWRIDDAPMENLKDSLGQAFDVERKPDEDRRDYFNRVKDQLDDRLIRAMQEATEIALHPRAEIPRGQPLDPANKHQEMLVLRLFGATMRGEIAEALPESLVGVKEPKGAVKNRSELIGEYLGFLRPTGDETS